MIVLALSSVFAVGTVRAMGPAECCGALMGGGECNLQIPKHACFFDHECTDEPFTVCCFTGGWCDTIIE